MFFYLIINIVICSQDNCMIITARMFFSHAYTCDDAVSFILYLVYFKNKYVGCVSSTD